MLSSKAVTTINSINWINFLNSYPSFESILHDKMIMIIESHILSRTGTYDK